MPRINRYKLDGVSGFNRSASRTGSSEVRTTDTTGRAGESVSFRKRCGVEQAGGQHTSSGLELRDEVFPNNFQKSGLVESAVLIKPADNEATMATTTNPFTDVRPKRAVVRCHSLLNWPRERLPQLWQRFISDIRGPAKPTCPDCGRPMILRKVKYGREAGKEFWDCSNFLRCSRKLDSGTATLRMSKSPFSA